MRQSSTPNHRSSLDFIIALTKKHLGQGPTPLSLDDATVETIARSLGSLFATHPVSGLLTGAGGVRVGVIEAGRSWTTQTGVPLFYVEADLMNLGGVNAEVGASQANELFIKPAVSILLDELHRLTEEAGAWFEAWHHGGDELSFLVAGVNERALTVALDTAVRRTYEHCREKGLAFIPHPKQRWRFSKWGAGLSYGFTLVNGSPLQEIFSRADTRLERYKRGLANTAADPRELSWNDRRRMLRILFERMIRSLLRR